MNFIFIQKYRKLPQVSSSNWNIILNIIQIYFILWIIYGSNIYALFHSQVKHGVENGKEMKLPPKSSALENAHLESQETSMRSIRN